MSELAPILARLGALLGAHGEPQELNGGITNRNFKVAFGDTQYVVRLPGKDTELLGIDRKNEWAATCAAARLGVGAPTTAMFDKPTCIVTRFVEGDVLEPSDLRGPEALGGVARALRTMHDSGTLLPTAFSPFEIVRHYARVGREHGVWAPDGYKDALRRSRQIEAAMRGPEHAPAPCHNDLLAANFIRHDGTFCIVDWEYAGMGDRFFDLGNFAANNGLDAAGEEVLLDAYFGEPPTRARRGALKLMRFMSDFREATWGVAQSAISQLDFDFDAYAAKHFERLAALSAEREFDRWIKDARAAHA